jgi:MFS family permease
MGLVPNHVGTQSFYRNLALESLEQHVPPVPPRRSNGSAEAAKDIVVELNIDRETDDAGPASDLTPFAKEYLTKRHGTCDMDPMPSACDEDPYNWPRSKKLSVVLLISFHGMVASLSMTAVIPAYSQLSEEFGETVHACTYLFLVQVIVLGVAPLAWGPLATVYGRRPAFLVSLIMSVIGNVACGVSPNYGAMMFFRAFVAFFLSPASALSSAIVTDIFFRTERARGVGICTLMFSLGVPFGPFVFGFVTHRAGFRWIFWVFAIVNGVQFIIHFLIGHETVFIRHLDMPEGAAEEKPKRFMANLLKFERLGSKRVSKVDFFEPLAMSAYPCAILPSLAQSVIFLFGSIFLVVEIPLQLEHKFHLSPDQASLQFLGMIIGSILAEPVGGLVSDVGMNLRRTMAKEDVAPPEFRLWLSYFGYCLLLTGVPLFLVPTENAVTGRWTIVPVVGTAIAAGGHQVAMTTLVTYTVDCAVDDAVSVGVFVSLWRQLIAFIGPLW